MLDGPRLRVLWFVAAQCSVVSVYPAVLGGGFVENQGLFTLPSVVVDSVARSTENDISVVAYDLVRDDLLCGLSPVFAVYSMVISGVLWSLW